MTEPVPMQVRYDVPIEMDDGVVLRADVFLPPESGRYPVILSHGPYAKNYHFADRSSGPYEVLRRDYPEIFEGTSGKYFNWETVDPEKWVPDGYVCVRVDSRGAGRSPGYLDIHSYREIQDFARCIEWAGEQPWSNGRVGLLGISYYAMGQWQVAALRPKHLAAICPWEGGVDHYRDFSHQGGILSTFITNWYGRSVLSVQHGVGERGPRDRNTGEPVAGPETLDEEELARNREDNVAELRARPLDSDYYRERSGDPSAIQVPVLSAANWSHPLHTRGNFDAFTALPPHLRWLEAHGLEHYTTFYLDEGLALQKRFFGHFLRDEDTGWQDQPRVSLKVRTADGGFIPRAEQEWPLARTQWTRYHLSFNDQSLSTTPPTRDSEVTFDALGEGVTLSTPPLTEDLELTGPAAAKLFVTSSTEDADLFVVLRAFRPDGSDVTFRTAIDPNGPVGFGWLRASHRKLDPARSLPYRPWHTHDELQPLTPGETVECDVEIWPTSIIIPAGYRLAVTILGRDFAFPGPGPWPKRGDVELRGSGIFFHDDPYDRPASIYGGRTTLSTRPDRSAYLLLPVIPPRSDGDDDR